MLLIADDYSYNPGINKAIRTLIENGVLQGTSCMVLSKSWHEDAADLKVTRLTHPELQIGLHLTFTGSDFRPLITDHFADGLPDKQHLLLKSSLRKLDQRWLEMEIHAQMEEFERVMGFPPHFVDGHEHVHLFPAIGATLRAVLQKRSFSGWVRQCGGQIAHILARPALLKSLLLEAFSRSFRKQCFEAGLQTNPDFTGLYSFEENADYAMLMRYWRAHSDARTVCMCHPGLADPNDHMPDPILVARIKEYAYLLDCIDDRKT